MSIRTSTLVFSLAMIVLASASACDVDRDSQADPAASEAYFGPAGQVEVASNGSASPSLSVSAIAKATAAASVHPSQNRGKTASPSASVTASAPSATGDFTFTVHGCSWFSSGGKLFIRPVVDVLWSGSTPYPKHTVSAATDVGQFKRSLEFAAAGTFFVLGGSPAAGNVWLGKAIRITITADAKSVVPELSETNNVRELIVAVPSSPPTSDQALSCS